MAILEIQSYLKLHWKFEILKLYFIEIYVLYGIGYLLYVIVGKLEKQWLKI